MYVLLSVTKQMNKHSKSCSQYYFLFEWSSSKCTDRCTAFRNWKWLFAPHNLDAYVRAQRTMEASAPTTCLTTIVLSTDTNNFRGILPSSLEQWSSLEFLDISDNLFTGPLVDFGNWTKLQSLAVGTFIAFGRLYMSLQPCLTTMQQTVIWQEQFLHRLVPWHL